MVDDTKTEALKVPEEPQNGVPDPVVKHHSLTINGKTLEYTTTTGLMPIRDDKGELKAKLFFTAYTLDGVEDTGSRPLTFTYNGGPGSASVWLHMGGLAPKRVEMEPDGGMPRPPFRLVDNE